MILCVLILKKDDKEHVDVQHLPNNSHEIQAPMNPPSENHSQPRLDSPKVEPKPYKGIINPNSIVYVKHNGEILPTNRYREYLGYRDNSGLIWKTYQKPIFWKGYATTGSYPTKCIIMDIETQGKYTYFLICDHIRYYNNAPLRRMYYVRKMDVKVTDNHTSEKISDYDEYMYLRNLPPSTIQGVPFNQRRP
ncbi:MAG: hypothetical protein DWQ19_11540 [Crenarchaeota archaeon]|nr:MAG: hypothetical protein DWQ19_11540 [Thermoproteota archaeon]